MKTFSNNLFLDYILTLVSKEFNISICVILSPSRKNVLTRKAFSHICKGYGIEDEIISSKINRTRSTINYYIECSYGHILIDKDYKFKVENIKSMVENLFKIELNDYDKIKKI